MSGTDKRDITLVDAFRPQLPAGKYTLTATQALVVETASGKTATWTETKTFWVRAPRFALAPDEIYSVYPPDGQTGAYHDTVPHVVFRRKALPWERKITGEGQKKAPPWMALLLFDEDELAEIRIATSALKDVASPPAGIRGPRIDLDAWEKDEPSDPGEVNKNLCPTIDLPGPSFRRIVPRLGELGLLAHARHVATGDKEDVPGIGDGWFSVLLANRLPAEGKRNTAFVVSLEGFDDLIGDSEPSTLPARIRLAVLATWSFTSRGPTFRDLLDALDAGWLRVMPSRPVQNETVGKALELGYVPLSHRLRQGDRTVSWYRGALVPVVVPPEIRNLTYTNADEALQFDPAAGLFDVSYASAWQLGRLLALQAPAFAQALFHWKSGYAADALIKEAVAKIEEKQLFGDFPADAAKCAELLQDEMMAAIALEWCS